MISCVIQQDLCLWKVAYIEDNEFEQWLDDFLLFEGNFSTHYVVCSSNIQITDIVHDQHIE